MKIIAIAMQKGGVGKSTLTRSLAVVGSAAGLNILALDMDVQQSTTQWAERRTAPLAVKFTTEIDLAKMLKQAEAADFVLVPCTPDIESYEQLPRTARLARTTGKPAAVVLTMVQPNSANEERIAAEVFKTIGTPMAGAILHRFKVHRDASREGETAQEMEPDSKASQEIQQLWEWLCAELQVGTGAAVHEKRVRK